jgi:hypothetical protein
VIGDRADCRPCLGETDDDDRTSFSAWLDYGEPMGHVGFVVTRATGKPPNQLRAKLNEFVMLQ